MEDVTMWPSTPSRRLSRKTSIADEAVVSDSRGGVVVGDGVAASPPYLSPLTSPSRRVRRKSAIDVVSPRVPVSVSAAVADVATEGCGGGASASASGVADEAERAHVGVGKGRGRGSGAGRRGRNGRGNGRGLGAVGVPVAQPAPQLRRSVRVAARAVGVVGQAPVAASGGARIVTGFGNDRVEDVAADERRRVADGAQRGSQRREDGTRGRMATFGGVDLDRSAGGAWHAGRK